MTQETARSRWWYVFCLSLASLVVVAAVAGALVVRPIADDFTMEATQTHYGNPGAAFIHWITTWTGSFSMSAILSLGVAFGRLLRPQVYYPLAAIMLLALGAAAVRQVVFRWSRATSVTLPLWPATLVAGAAVVGGLNSWPYRWRATTYGAMYWQTAFVPHVVPMLLIPLTVAVALRAARSGSRAAITAVVVLAFVSAGFAFAESAVAAASFAVAAWLAHQLGRRRLSALLVAATVAVICGGALAYGLPGTSARQHVFASDGLGFAGGSGNMSHLASSVGWIAQNLESPSWLATLVAAAYLRRRAGDEPSAVERRLVRLSLVGALALLVFSVLAVGVGDAVSYRAWWHLFPVWFCASFAGGVAGWRIGMIPRLPQSAAAAATAVGLLWGTATAGTAAATSWSRRASMDHNLAAMHGRGTLNWRSQSVGDIVDVQEMKRFWVDEAVEEWSGRSASQLHFVYVPEPAAETPFLWLQHVREG